MTHQEIQKSARKKVEAKKGFFVVSMIFGAIAVVLMVIAFGINFESFVRFWILFPILIFALVLVIMYFSIFGIPGTYFLTDEWESEQLKLETNRMHRQQGVNFPQSTEKLSEEDRLELKELERLKQKWEGDDLV